MSCTRGEAHLNSVISWCVLMSVVGRVICLDLAVQVHFCHFNHFFPVPMVFLCKFGQNPPISSRDRVQTSLIFTVFIVWWPWKLGQDHQYLINSLIIPMIPNIKVCWNPSFGSRDMVQTSFFWSKFENFEVLVWPWKWYQGHQNLITSFPCPNNVSVPVWSKSTNCSEDTVQTSSYTDADKFDIKKCFCDLENEVKVTKI